MAETADERRRREQLEELRKMQEEIRAREAAEAKAQEDRVFQSAQEAARREQERESQRKRNAETQNVAPNDMPKPETTPSLLDILTGTQKPSRVR